MLSFEFKRDFQFKMLVYGAYTVTDIYLRIFCPLAFNNNIELERKMQLNKISINETRTHFV